MTYSNPGAFLALHDALSRLKSGVTAAEAHGILTAALICGGHESTWMPQLAGENPQDDFDIMANEARNTLRELAEETLKLLHDESLSFSPLVPDDDDSLQERVDGLRGWCQGFLSGLGQNADIKKLQEKSDVKDALYDLESVSQMEFVDEASEADEKAYAEIHEFVRMAVLFIQDSMIGDMKVAQNKTLSKETVGD